MITVNLPGRLCCCCCCCWLLPHCSSFQSHCTVSDLRLHQIKSNQIYLPAQNIKEKQLKNIRLTQKNQRHTDYECYSRTQRQRDCSYMSPKNKHKHNNDNVYNNMNFKYYKVGKMQLFYFFCLKATTELDITIQSGREFHTLTMRSMQSVHHFFHLYD